MIIPVVHSPEDLGSLAADVDAIKCSFLSPKAIDAARSSVRQFWSELRSGIEAWDIDFSTVRLYQDALPHSAAENSGIEKMIVDDLASKGSQNHQILKWLIEQGATLLGTESPQLLIEEYQQVKAAMERFMENADSDAADDAQNPLSDTAAQVSLLEQRDQFIADRIDATLDVDATGLLFLGMRHAVEAKLPDDIEITYPFGEPMRMIPESN